MRCPAQYYFRYIQKLKQAPSGPLHFGITFDEGISFNYEQKVTTEKDLPKDDVTDVFLDKFDGGKKEVEWYDEDVEETRDKGIKLVDLHMTDHAPAIKPKLVQEKIEIVVPSVKKKIITVPDLITTDGKVTDFKTTGKTPNKNKETGLFMPSEENLRQGMLYSVAHEAKIGYSPLAVELIYHVKTKTPKIVVVTVATSQAQEEFAIGQVQRVERAITACENEKIYYPNRGHMMCSRKMCGFWLECEQRYGGDVKEDRITKK